MRAATLLVLAVAAGTAGAQTRVVGTVPVSDASATGVLEVSGGRSILGNASAVSTGGRAAHVMLFRGGELEVCQGSTARLNTSPALTGKADPLVVGLNRGALELRTSLTAGDAVMTPDLRIVAADGHDHSIDLALRVTRNGDTCIDNRGKKAPFLNVSDSFDTGTYQIRPGQRVLFEHGSLREVVDREQGPCGCPAPASLAADPKQPFPFPEAVSEGLADPTPPPPEAPGATHTQVAGSLNAAPGADPTAATLAPLPQTPAPPPAENKPGFFASIGHFFKRLFVR